MQSRVVVTVIEQRLPASVAAPRAEERYRDGIRRLVGPAATGTYCIAGVRDASDIGGSGSMDAGAISSLAASCPPSPVVVKFVDGKAADVFEDWSGHVSVGAIDPVQTRSQ